MKFCIREGLKKKNNKKKATHNLKVCFNLISRFLFLLAKEQKMGALPWLVQTESQIGLGWKGP